MKPELMHRIEEIFHAACELPSAERQAYLERACGSDDDLRREVELLLASDGAAGSLFESPAYERAAPLIAGDQIQITPGMKISHYEILSRLGAGGMGEVWRARDTSLKREVAIKVLPLEFAQDAERLRRFEREAHAASALNHPNIITIFEIGSFESTRFIVTELIDGQTLRQHMESSRMKLPEVLKTAVQIASALAAAHDAGIIHRDIKPENVMVRSDGLVKVLDFGLAKLKPEQLTGAVDLEESTKKALTASGVVMGTVGYMSPEQVRGQDADHRSDIFSFGVLLYEMLSGQRPFQGESMAETMAAIANEEPPELSGINSEIPSSLERIVNRCLEKQPGRRFQNASDLGFALEGLSNTTGLRTKADTSTNDASTWRLLGATRSVLLASAIIILLALISLPFIISYFRQAKPTNGPAYRFSINVPAKTTLLALALSPDGNQLAINVRDTAGNYLIYLRPLSAEWAQKLEGTNGARYPFWSPDSRSIGFFAGGKLKRIEVSGGPAQTLCDAEFGSGGTWNRDGLIIFAKGNGIHSVSSTGGEPSPLSSIDRSIGKYPHFLPDGRSFLYCVGPDVYVGTLDGNKNRKLIQADSNAVYASPGYLLFTRKQTLMAQAFDLYKLSTVGEIFPISKIFGTASNQMQPESLNINTINNFMALTISENGTLVYQRNYLNQTQLIWLDRSGRQNGVFRSEVVPLSFRISPDGRRLAYHRGVDIWIQDIHGGNPTLLTANTKHGFIPVWSPDSSRVIYGTPRHDSSTKLYVVKEASGAGREDLIYDVNKTYNPYDWSSDGRFILCYIRNYKTGDDIWLMSLEEERKTSPFLVTVSSELWGMFSPNGKWFAYASDETGRYEIYIQRFPNLGDKQRVSNGGGMAPKWRRDGRELFYLGPDGKLMSVEISMKPHDELELGIPTTLFEIQNPMTSTAYEPLYEVTPDGQRFLVKSPVGQDDSPVITVVVNWAKGLKR